MKKFNIFILLILLTNISIITMINIISAQLASSSYGDVKITVADVTVNGISYGQTFVKYAEKGKDIAAKDLGQSGWSVGWSGPYLLSDKPFYKVQYAEPIIEFIGYENETIQINETANKTITYKVYNETLRIYEFYFWSVGYDLYMRTNAEIWAEIGAIQQVKAWDFYYTYYGWESPFATSITPYKGDPTAHEEGYIKYTPWNLYCGAGPVKFRIELLVELTPFTFGYDVVNDTYYIHNSWAGLMSADIIDFNSGLIENLGADEYQKIEEAQNWQLEAKTDEYDGDPEGPTTTIEQLAYAYQDLTTNYDLSGYNLGLIDSNPVLTTDITDLVQILQGFQANRDTLSTLMYTTDLTTQIQEREFNADLELTNAPSKALLLVEQQLKPQVTQYNNKITWKYYMVNMTDYDGYDLGGDPQLGWGDATVIRIIDYGSKTVTYPRSLVVKNVFARYTFNITYAQIFNFSKSDIRRVAKNETIVPFLPNVKLNETDMLADNFLEDESGGREDFIDLPPPTITQQEAEERSDIEKFWDSYMDYLQSPAGIISTIITIIVILIIVYMVLKALMMIYSPKIPKIYIQSEG